MFDDNKKIGIGLCGLGLIMTLMGVMFLFDRALLCLGNMAFLAGLAFLLGPEKTGRFFVRKKVPSAFFFGGFGISVFLWSIRVLF